MPAFLAAADKAAVIARAKALPGVVFYVKVMERHLEQGVGATDEGLRGDVSDPGRAAWVVRDA